MKPEQYMICHFGSVNLRTHLKLLFETRMSWVFDYAHLRNLLSSRENYTPLLRITPMELLGGSSTSIQLTELVSFIAPLSQTGNSYL